MSAYARDTDPATSHDAAAELRPHLKAMIRRVVEILATAGDDGMTAAEVMAYAQEHGIGLGVCPWRRVTDACARRLAEVVPDTKRPGPSGRLQQVIRVTEKGLDLVTS